MSFIIEKTRADLREVCAQIARCTPQVIRLCISVPMIMIGMMFTLPPMSLMYVGATFFIVGFVIFNWDGVYRRQRMARIDREIEQLTMAYSLGERESIEQFETSATYLEANRKGRFDTLDHPRTLGRVTARVVKRYRPKRDSAIGKLIDRLPPTPVILMFALIVFIPLYSAMKQAGG